MLWHVIIGALAAYGLLGVLWALFGWLLPGGRGCAVCCFGMPDEGILWRYRWIQAMGLWQIPLLVIPEDDRTDEIQMELCGRENLISRLEQERKHGTGIGDPAGRGQRCDLSEL